MNLMTHQIKGVEFFAKNDGQCAFFWSVGTGKTIGSLASFKYMQDRNAAQNTCALKLLIICPLSLIQGAWIKEIEKFYPGWIWYDLYGDNTNYKGRLNRNQIPNVDIYIINFEYLISEKKFEELVLMMRIDGADNEEWMCIIDESSKMKNHQSKTTERILEMKNLFRYRLIMSGTPAPNIEWEYWAQMKFVDDKILGSNFHKFKNICFALKRGNQMQSGIYMNKLALREMFKQGFKYEIKPEKRVEMFRRMQPFCQFIKSRDCIDLPEEVDEYRIIEMRPEQRKIYNSMKETFIAEIKNNLVSLDEGGIYNQEDNEVQSSVVVANIVLTKMLKLRQITSGFAIDEQQKAISFLKTNPKMEELLDIVEESGNEQIIIWGQFHHEIEQIVGELSKIANVSILYGKTPQAERLDHINRFIDGTNRFLVAHPDSAAHGLTFTNCHIQVFFSLSYSLEEYLQARGRTMRYGQKNNCVYFHIMAGQSIDEDILAILQKKTDKQAVAEKYLKG